MVTQKTIIWTLPAQNDLKAIYQYIANFSKQSAIKVRNSLIEKPVILQNTTSENIGVTEPLNTDLRYLVEGNYKIFYKILPEQILIVRVFGLSA